LRSLETARRIELGRTPCSRRWATCSRGWDATRTRCGSTVISWTQATEVGRYSVSEAQHFDCGSMKGEAAVSARRDAGTGPYEGRGSRVRPAATEKLDLASSWRSGPARPETGRPTHGARHVLIAAGRLSRRSLSSSRRGARSSKSRR
jgi:hypothetical protein